MNEEERRHGGGGGGSSTVACELAGMEREVEDKTPDTYSNNERRFSNLPS